MSLIASSPVHHTYKAHNPGCRTLKCDQRVGRRWWVKHHPTPEATLEAGVASWFDDSEGTACSKVSGPGVAHRTLPCGTQLRICYSGCETAYVEDRGPYIEGRVLDLDPEAKAGIGCPDICKMHWGVVH